MCTPPSTCSQPEPHWSTNVASVTVAKLLRVGLDCSALPSILLHRRAPFRGLLGTDGLFTAKSSPFLSEKYWDWLAPKSIAPHVVFEKNINGGFRLLFKWKLVIHVHVHVIRQWIRVWIAFKVTETLINLAIDQFNSTLQSIIDNHAPIIRRSVTLRPYAACYGWN